MAFFIEFGVICMRSMFVYSSRFILSLVHRQDVVSNLSMTASWVFRTWSLDGGNGESINMAEWGAGNFARIYGIDVTNTINGGASVCLPCPVGHTENGYVLELVGIVVMYI